VSGTGAEPIKVAVLGGGIGAMTAAFELTAPELEGRYEVTVYQPGWRLGGKCASGRSGPQNRIEEHGLHVWFGFYANAFNMIQRCYEEWRPPARSPLKTWQDAFKQCSDIVLFEHWGEEWTPWSVSLPTNPFTPGTRLELTPWELLHRLLHWLHGEWRELRAEHGHRMPAAARPRSHSPAALLQRLLFGVLHRIEDLEYEFLERALVAAEKLVLGTLEAGSDVQLARIEFLLRTFKRRVISDLLPRCQDHPEIRRFVFIVDFWSTTVTGMLDDHVFADGFGVLNREDLFAWLRRHGADPLTIEHGAFIHALYDLVFAYRDGDKAFPDLAAGKALQAMIRILTEYRGAVLWKMQAGMGDTVFTPLYDVLRSRGVTFRFFHQVTRLGVSPDGKSIATIEVQPQVRTLEPEYDPIVPAGHLRCWPSEPKWELLEGGKRLGERKPKINFEYDANPLGLDPMPPLRAGEDFDEVVLGIPVGALGPLCQDLVAANDRFAQMLAHSDTVMTEGIQLWLDRTATNLGWPYESAIGTSYVALADTYSNMAQLLARETWKSGRRPQDVAYLCGVINHAGIKTQAQADARVRANALAFLQNDSERLWPAAQNGSGEFDWETLVDSAGGSGQDRLDAQVLRANFQPTERYVMTRAGSVDYRLQADESGFANLKLAGDWTRNGIDGGSVEAAATSGMQAARAISGHPRRIQGERGWLVDDGN
jgi:uncharacterized protein with NAD-binding domain and iron-sulfur cluster